MRRRLFNSASTLSLVLCVAIVALWEWTGSGAHWGDPPMGWNLLKPLGFRWKIVGAVENAGPMYATNIPRSWYALAVLLAAILPAIRVVTTVRDTIRFRRNAQVNFCRCGYDLTGNVSGACPECGMLIVKKPEANA